MSRILIVDDEPSICWALEQALTEDGHEVETTATAEEALTLAERMRTDVVVMDIRLPGMDGLSALETLRSRLGDVPIIMITAFGNLSTAVEAIRRGAFEYLTKPFDLEDAVEVVRRALGEQEPTLEEADSQFETDAGGQILIGTSPAMQTVFRQIAVVAEYDVPVLITGESGTGKELVATAIHHYSQRSSGPFVPVCVPAMNESLIESELFGHAEGAFTGARRSRRGLLESANGGTAFFDEIGDIAAATQVKLLRVLETREITPVGSDRSRASDFRLIAATNQDVEGMVAAGTFREDLFYRLNVFRIEMPPLRERPEDIPHLARHFLRRLDPGGEVRLTEPVLEELTSRSWSGNVRELRNAIERAVVVTRAGEIAVDSLPSPRATAEEEKASCHLEEAVRRWWIEQVHSSSQSPQGSRNYEALLSRIEPVLFREALKLTKGNRQEAARLLGLHRQTLREKLRGYDLDPDEFA